MRPSILYPFLLLLLPACSSVGTPHLSAEARAAPVEGRNHTYVFFLNSPLDRPQLGRLASVADYTHRFFPHTTYLDWTTPSALAEQIQHLKAVDPAARIALIAWSGASLWAWDTAVLLAPHQISIDLIVYLDSDWLKQRLATRSPPENVAAVLLLYRQDHAPPTELSHSQAYIIPTTVHLAIAADPQTVDHLMHGLLTLAAQPPLPATSPSHPAVEEGW